MGALAPGSAHARPSAQPPIDTSEKFSAYMFGGGVKKFDKFQSILSTFFFLPKNTPKKWTHRGAGGAPKFCFTPNLNFFVT